MTSSKKPIKLSMLLKDISGLSEANLSRAFKDKAFKVERRLRTHASELPCVTDDSRLPSWISSPQLYTFKHHTYY